MSHALISPSGFAALMLCPGKPAMEYGEPDSSSEYADEGSAAHLLAAYCLQEDTAPGDYRGGRIEVLADSQRFVNPDARGNIFTVDAEMVAAVDAYLAVVKGLRRNADLMVEWSVPIGHITGEKGARGTADAIILAGNEIVVIDLKYGRTPVSAVENSQLRMYALGALKEFGPFGEFRTVRMVIVQPRAADAHSEWFCSVEELTKWGEEVARPVAATALIAFEHRANWIGKVEEMQYLSPGEEQCRWCKAKAKCPALSAKVLDTVSANDFDDMPEIAERIELLTPESLAAKASACDLIEHWIKAIRGRLERDLLEGKQVPGWKLVQGKRGNRAWANEADAEKLLKSMRLKHDEMYSYKVISPTTAEKIFGPKGSAPSVKRWNTLQSIITQKDGTPSVAPASDKRPALVLDKSVGFADETGSDLA